MADAGTTAPASAATAGMKADAKEASSQTPADTRAPLDGRRVALASMREAASATTGVPAISIQSAVTANGAGLPRSAFCLSTMKDQAALQSRAAWYCCVHCSPQEKDQLNLTKDIRSFAPLADTDLHRKAAAMKQAAVAELMKGLDSRTAAEYQRRIEANFGNSPKEMNALLNFVTMREGEVSLARIQQNILEQMKARGLTDSAAILDQLAKLKGQFSGHQKREIDRYLAVENKQLPADKIGQSKMLAGRALILHASGVVGAVAITKLEAALKAGGCEMDGPGSIAAVEKKLALDASKGERELLCLKSQVFGALEKWNEKKSPGTVLTMTLEPARKAGSKRSGSAKTRSGSAQKSGSAHKSGSAKQSGSNRPDKPASDRKQNESSVGGRVVKPESKRIGASRSTFSIGLGLTDHKVSSWGNSGVKQPGATVTRIAPNSVFRGKIRAGDVIRYVNGKLVTTPAEASTFLKAAFTDAQAKKQQVRIKVDRKGTQSEVVIDAAKRAVPWSRGNAAKPASKPVAAPQKAIYSIGLGLTDHKVSSWGNSGVKQPGATVTRVAVDSVFRGKIRAGDVIRYVNGKLVTTPAEASTFLKTAFTETQAKMQQVRILVDRNGIQSKVVINSVEAKKTRM